MFKRLTLRHWSWIHFKLAMLAWVGMLLAFTPTAVFGALGGVVVLISAVTIGGALTGIIGLIMSAQTGRTAVIGISIELAGLLFMAAGPVAYLITQIFLATLPAGNQRYALVLLAYVVCSALLCRILIVAPRVRQEAHDQSKDLS